MKRALLCGATTLILLAACGGEGSLADVPTSVCESGKQWQSGNEGSPLMHPGGDCIGCHGGGEGPSFGAAGTVFGALSEATDCAGVEGVTVRLTGASGQTAETTTNAAGNFYFDDGEIAGLATPYQVEIEQGGRTSAMGTAISTGNCASCHTAQGANGAPGRVVAP